MKSLFVDVLVNHDTGVKKHYLRIKESELLQEYLNAVDALTINSENRLRRQIETLKIDTDTDKFTKLENEIKKLRELVER